jgi:hypothetical protein
MIEQIVITTFFVLFMIVIQYFMLKWFSEFDLYNFKKVGMIINIIWWLIVIFGVLILLNINRG